MAIYVNFLDFGEKELDWRYKNYEVLHSKSEKDGQKFVYWIGVLDLRFINMKKHIAPLSFANRKGAMITDGFIIRESDGAPSGKLTGSPYLYDFSEIHEYVWNLKKKWYFLHFFLEEKVEWSGLHKISLLYRKIFPNMIYGVPMKNTFLNRPLKKCASYSKQSLDNVERMCILSNRPYNWLK